LTEEDIQPLIIDASTLIDFIEADPEILTIAGNCFGGIHVSGPVLADELNRFDTADCDRYGITVTDGTTQQIMEAQSLEGALFLYDWHGIILARDNGWTLLTNDGAQRREALASGIPVIRGFGLLVTLVQEQTLETERARRTGALIRQANTWITQDVLEEFTRLLDELTEN